MKFFIIIIYFILQIGLSRVLKDYLISYIPENQFIGVLMFIVDIISFIVIAYLYRKELKKAFNKVMNLKWLKEFGINFLFLIAALFVSSLISNILLSIFSPDYISSVNQDIINQAIFETPILMGFTVSITGPFIEEIVFRGCFGNLTKFKIINLILGTLPFALIHIDFMQVSELCLLPVYFGMALTLYNAYEKDHDIRQSIILHMSYNFLTYLMILYVL